MQMKKLKKAKYRDHRIVYSSVNETNENKENKLNIKSILNRKNKKRHDQVSENEILDEQELYFKYAAIVFDRLFLCVAFIYALITFVTLIMSNPNFYK